MLGRADLHLHFSSVPTDGLDVHRFINRKCVFNVHCWQVSKVILSIVWKKAQLTRRLRSHLPNTFMVPFHIGKKTCHLFFTYPWDSPLTIQDSVFSCSFTELFAKKISLMIGALPVRDPWSAPIVGSVSYLLLDSSS